MFSLHRDRSTNKEVRSLIGETEVQKNHKNPEFKTTFHVDYMFQKHQRYVAVVYDFDDHDDREVIGEACFELGNVISRLAKGLTTNIQLKSKNRGQLKVKATRNQNEHFEYHFKVKCQKVKDIEVFSKTDPFLTIDAPSAKNFDTNNFKKVTWVQRFQTEYIKDNLNPKFRPFKIKAGRLNRGNESVKLRWTIFDYSKKGTPDWIGSVEISI